MSTYASGTGEAAAVQGLVSGAASSFTAATYMSLHNASPSTTGANEITGTTSYARQSITWGTASSTTGIVANTNAIAFTIGSATSGIAYFGYQTAVTSGVYYIGGLLSTSVSFSSTGTLAIAIGGATLGATG